jgi:hypothetical protein
MKSILIALVFGVLFSGVSYSQDKTDKSCCSGEKSKTMSKICDVPDEVSVSSNNKNELTASVQGDDKNKKVEKNAKSIDKSVKKDKSKGSSHEDDCCSPNKTKTEKSKNSNKS